MVAAITRCRNFRPSGASSISVITRPTTRCSATSPAGRRRSSSDRVWRARSIITAPASPLICDGLSVMVGAPIPQTDPKAGYLAARDAIDAAIARVLTGGAYIPGPEAENFARDFAAFIGCRHAVGVASGTDALVLALRALAPAADDYVATASHTAVATVAAIELAGARPLLVDVERATLTLDPAALARAFAGVDGRIAAVIPVHLYGLGADMSALG